MSEQEEKFVRDARRVLDDSLGDIDGLTSARLTAVRLRALEQAKRKPRRWLLWGSLPAGLVAALLLFLLWPSAPLHQVTEPDPADLNILTASEPLEFYQEDMEFYQWVSEVLDHENELSDVHAPDASEPATSRLVGAGGECGGSAESRNA